MDNSRVQKNKEFRHGCKNASRQKESGRAALWSASAVDGELERDEKSGFYFQFQGEFVFLSGFLPHSRRWLRLKHSLGLQDFTTLPTMNLFASLAALFLFAPSVFAFTGKASFFAPGLGACGQYHKESDYVSACSE